MLAVSQIKDLFAGKLSDQLAHQSLLDLNKQKPSPALINELVSNILEMSDRSIIEPLIQSFANVGELIDCCGTGGSGISHYNTSTTIAFVLAAGGLKTAKFGNRSASGISGSFDFLELLGVPVSLPPSRLPAILEKTNLVFLFAPQFYPALGRLTPIRKAITGPTIFNLIGPLLNPLNPPLRILGAATKDSQQAIADYLRSHADNASSFVVRADSGMDELDPAANNTILAVNKSSITESILPASQDKQFTNCFSSTAAENAHLFKEMINDFSSAPLYLRSLVTLNAGAAFLLSGKVTNIEAGQKLAANLLQSGQVLAKYEQCRSFYAQYA